MPFIPWRAEERPVDWPKKFGRTGPLAVEVGFGLGDFLVREARAHPECDFVGIESGWVPLKRALRKIALAGVGNVRVVKLDARVALERMFAEETVDRAYSLFPCPWPKKRHAKNRLFSHDFLRLLNSRIKPGGDAFMVTDHPLFLDWVLSQVPGTGFSPGTGTVPPGFMTKYERKWQAMGQERFYRLTMIKREHIPIPSKEDARLITHRVHRFDPDRLRPIKMRGDIMVEIKEVLYDPQRLKGMVRTAVAEDGVLQDFWIEAVLIGDSWHIRPAKGCGMVPTAGVQRALDLIRDAAAG
jgi:tRNA (guanine-N7-)-methyltransferase